MRLLRRPRTTDARILRLAESLYINWTQFAIVEFGTGHPRWQYLREDLKAHWIDVAERTSTVYADIFSEAI